MIIRKAELKDINDIVKLGFLEFLEEHCFETGQDFSYKSVSKNLEVIINNENIGFVMVAETEIESSKIIGFILVQYSCFIFSRQVIAHEIGWYIIREYRGKGAGGSLIKKAMDEVKEKGITILSLGMAFKNGSENQSLMYQKYGFKPFQSFWFKEL
ncbi:MAG: GNAT family N-acetyltransferase [Desulfobacterales bacterium]|nr:GNAT family N-acetyltransferase [Desulfobacterales bacterium]